MTVIIIKNRFGRRSTEAHEIDLVDAVPVSREKFYSADVILFSTETRFFTFIQINRTTGELKIEEALANQSFQEKDRFLRSNLALL